jgi:hypothetical protein
MRRSVVLAILLLTAAISSATYGAEAWSISAQRPCTGLTVGFAKPLAELNQLVGLHWQAAPGPVKGQGLVLLFVTTCPDSSAAGKSTGAFSGAFVLVPVEQKAQAEKQTHAIAVLRATGRVGTPVMKLFRSHGIPVGDASVSLEINGHSNGERAQAVIHSAQGTLTIDADMLPETRPYKSDNTIAVRVKPAGILFSGPESSTRYAGGKAVAHAVADTWLKRYELGTPLFVTLDTDFLWDFDFSEMPHS